jgi:hypothetical protein
MANLNVTVQDGNNINVEVTPTAQQTITIDRGVSGVGIESVGIVFIAPNYFLEFTYTDGTTELVELPAIASGVVSFNTRIGVVTLTSADVTTALGYTPPTPTGTGASGTWSISVNGNAGTVTNGVYTTDTGTVTNTMLAGSIANSKLVNSAITINGSSTALGGSVNVGTVTSVTGTAPVVSSGGTTPAISMAAATTAVNGYLTSTDWNTFNNKTSNTGTVTSVGGTGTVNGITLTGTVTTSGNITLGGALSGVNLATQVTGTLPPANGGTGITALGTGVATFLGTPTSANLAAAVTDETGTGALVFGTSPTLTAPIITGGTFNPTTLQENGSPVVVQTDIGTAPNEIPLNQYLGNLAYQDAANIAGNVGVGGVLTVQAGTAALPSVTPIGDTNTGLFFPAADTIAFSEGGVEAMRIDSVGNVGIGVTPNASALLDVQSTTKGVRMPNMTTTQKNAIASPAAGLMVFDTTLSKLSVYSGVAWQTITSV